MSSMIKSTTRRKWRGWRSIIPCIAHSASTIDRTAGDLPQWVFNAPACEGASVSAANALGYSDLEPATPLTPDVVPPTGTETPPGDGVADDPDVDSKLFRAALTWAREVVEENEGQLQSLEDTVRVKDEEIEKTTLLFLEERQRRRFEKCLLELVNRNVVAEEEAWRKEFELQRKSLAVLSNKLESVEAEIPILEGVIRRKDDRARAISHLVVEEKQRRLLAKCLVEITDCRRRCEDRKREEVIAQECVKRQDGEEKIALLLSEIERLKEMAPLKGDGKDDPTAGQTAPLQIENRDLKEKLGRTSQLLLHTKDQHYDLVNLYQESRRKVDELEKVIDRARQTASQICTDGRTTLAVKEQLLGSTATRQDCCSCRASGKHPSFDLEDELVTFTWKATWLAGSLAADLPPRWQGPSRGSEPGTEAHCLRYDPLGLYNANPDTQCSPPSRYKSTLMTETSGNQNDSVADLCAVRSESRLGQRPSSTLATVPDTSNLYLSKSTYHMSSENKFPKSPQTMDIYSTSSPTNQLSWDNKLLKIPETMDIYSNSRPTNQLSSGNKLPKSPETMDIYSTSRPMNLLSRDNKLLKIPETKDIYSTSRPTNQLSSDNKLLKSRETNYSSRSARIFSPRSGYKSAQISPEKQDRKIGDGGYPARKNRSSWRRNPAQGVAVDKVDASDRG